MELNITRFFKDADPADFSASQMELGQFAGKITWNNAMQGAPQYNILDTDEKKEAVRKGIKGYGAWSAEEIAAWSDTELTALLLQFVASEMRECGIDSSFTDEDWNAYESSENAGRIFKGIDGEIYYYVGD